MGLLTRILNSLSLTSWPYQYQPTVELHPIIPKESPAKVRS